jgi:hypothetical protein
MCGFALALDQDATMKRVCGHLHVHSDWWGLLDYFLSLPHKYGQLHMCCFVFYNFVSMSAVHLHRSMRVSAFDAAELLNNAHALC